MQSRSVGAVVLMTLMPLASVLGIARPDPIDDKPTPAGKALHDAATAWQHAFDTKDIDKIVSLFADDVIAMYPLPKPTEGREANREAWVSYFSRHATHPITTDTVIVSTAGDLGYTLGRWWSSSDPAERDIAGGRYVAVWRRVTGQWRIAVLSAHVHEPMPSLLVPPLSTHRR